jgi:phytol kinase
MVRLNAVPTLWLQVALVAAWLGLVGLVAEVVRRRTLANSELTRKIVHIGTGNIILLAWWLQIPAWVSILCSILFSGVALLSYYLPILPGINGIGRRSLGTFFYAVSIGVLVAWFWALNLPQYAALGILVMTWGDGLAAIVGQRFGRHPYHLWDMQKSWEGSLTMLLVSFGISFLILIATRGNSLLSAGIALTIAVTATGLEAFSKFGVDNLTVPIGSAAIAFFLTQHLLP